jgi:A/G-specific adenine glycosylase
MGDHGRIGRALLAHYDRTARDLPWRGTSDPYAIWVSEIMLQQTRVATAVPFYESWMARFPTVDTLAEADLDEVLASWSGLGYYSRARNLHRSAGIVRERFNGNVPESVRDLRSLPGVGEYAAGAIASIAFGRREPAVDGNVRRVLARLYDLATTSPAALKRLAFDLQDPKRPGDFNQALMELGATLCTPRAPECDACPLSGFCLARTRGTVGDRPAPRRRARVREVSFLSFILVDAKRRTLLVQRPAEGLLASMWEFPALELDEPVASSTVAPPGVHSPDVDSLGARFATVLPPVSHEFTHLRATYHPVVLLGPASPDALRRAVSELEWMSPLDLSGRPTRVQRLDALEGLAIPAGQLKIAKRVLDAVAASG